MEMYHENLKRLINSPREGHYSMDISHAQSFFFLNYFITVFKLIAIQS